ncbi:glycosyltransferase [Paracoccus sp. JM45]|uniref:glycosyltransferase n=1 Tax=Paracoccus sp. JM45 TaxID=2283626 RepID=UPI000E6CFC72|nr:glycosyltransferase [Paracoccus sp. JM45]RJE80942.1 glycosyltransferase [Paracoccus sp. JM45]
MSKTASLAASSYIESQILEFRAIYERIFTTQHLRYIVELGINAVWSKPEVIEGVYIPGPQDLGPQFLGTIERPGLREDSPEVTIRISIPRPPLPSETKQTDAPWRPQARLGRLFAASPMAYEYIRFQAEMRRKRHAGRRNRMTAISFNKGADLLPDAQRPETTQRPAALIGMHWLETGGAEKLGFDTIRWALESGLRVFVVASVPSLQRYADRLPDHPDVTFIRLDRWLPHHLWARFVEKLVLQENIALVHNHHCIPFYELLPLLRSRMPWVKTIDSTHIVEHADGGYPRISGVWSNYLDVQHVISGELVDYMQGQFNAPPSKVVLGRMLDRKDGQIPMPDLRLQAGQKTLHVAFVGRMYYQKRPVVVVETLRALDVWAKKNNVAFSATMVGEGPFEHAVTRLLRRYGLGSKVAQLPGNTDVPALLEQSDILILPSNNEGLALVCYEAITHGCIPISSRVGSQDELLPDDLLVPAQPYQGVRQTVFAIDRMFNDNSFLQRQKDGIRAKWQKLSADPTAEEVLKPIYRAAVEDALGD